MDREKVIKEYEEFVDKYECFSSSDDYVLEMHKAVLALLKEQEEQKRKWLQNIADNQLANAPMDGCCLEQWNYQKGVYDGLQMAYDILTEGR